MEKRGSFQGVANIVRFNWHFYVLAGVALMGLWACTPYLSAFWRALWPWVLVMPALSMALSLLASFYVYDCSGLYSLQWLPAGISPQRLLNIHAGFDETSALLQQQYPNSALTVFDFYDPAKHTEISIARARKAYPLHPHTHSVNTQALPIEKNSFDAIFAILSAHEIRAGEERVAFFSALREGLKEDGHIIVVEHLRDLPNFLAYNIGFFHFLSERQWRETFSGAGLSLVEKTSITPFISVFLLRKSHSNQAKWRFT